MGEGRLRAGFRAFGLGMMAACSACAEGVIAPAPEEEQGATAAPDRNDWDAGLGSPLDSESSSEPPEPELVDAGQSERDAQAVTTDATSPSDATLGADGSAAAPADAAASDAALDASPSDAAPACTSCALKVQWNTSTTTAATPSIAGYLKLINTGATAIALSSVSVRYWLREPMAEGMQVECYHWDDGKGVNKCVRPMGASANTYTSLTARVGSVAGDLRFIELTFPAAAGELAQGGAAPGALQLAFHLPNYTPLTQSDDPSFDALLTASASSMLFDAPKITAYLDGKLAWGTEP